MRGGGGSRERIEKKKPRKTRLADVRFNTLKEEMKP